MTADKLDVEPPTLPRKRKRPQRYEGGSAEPEFHDSPKAYFKVSYFEGLDLVTTSIQERFDQQGFRVYRNLQELVTKAAKGDKYDEEYDFVVSFYEGGQIELLCTHFTAHASTLSFVDVIHFLKDLSA